MERDILILKLVGQWQLIFSRHIKELANFNTLSGCGKRLKILTDNDYLEKQKIFYEHPYIYSLTPKSKKLIGLNKRIPKIRLDQFHHDIIVIESAIFFIKNYDISLNDIMSEKQLSRLDGFHPKKHRPDFTYKRNNNIYAVEIELNVKSFQDLEKNVCQNYLNFSGQIWIIKHNSTRILRNLTKLQEQYPNIKILFLEDLQCQ